MWASATRLEHCRPTWERAGLEHAEGEERRRVRMVDLSQPVGLLAWAYTWEQRKRAAGLGGRELG